VPFRIPARLRCAGFAADLVGAATVFSLLTGWCHRVLLSRWADLALVEVFAVGLCPARACFLSWAASRIGLDLNCGAAATASSQPALRVFLRGADVAAASVKDRSLTSPCPDRTVPRDRHQQGCASPLRPRVWQSAPRSIAVQSRHRTQSKQQLWIFIEPRADAIETVHVLAHRTIVRTTAVNRISDGRGNGRI